MDTYRVGIIGCGKMGAEHARAYQAHPRTEIVAIADPNPRNLQAFGDRFGVDARYTRYQDLLAGVHIDIAAVVVPVSVNPEIVLACAEAGVRAIYCEKPIAASLQLADQMVEACRTRAIPLACGAIWRSHPSLQVARSLLAAGEVGEIVGLDVYHASGEISGGGCHSLNVARTLAGDPEVEWVVGWMQGDPWLETDQSAGGVIRFAGPATKPDGTPGEPLDLHLHHRTNIVSGVRVLGSHGGLLWDWQDIHLWKAAGPAVASGVPPSYRDMQVIPFVHPPLAMPGIYPAITGGLHSLLGCIEHGGEPLCSGADMRWALEIAIALRESHRRGHGAMGLPLADRSLQIIPRPYRWLGGEPVEE